MTIPKETGKIPEFRDRPVSATVFMVVWLKEPFMLIDLAGFLCIFITVFLLVKKEDDSEPEVSGSAIS